ncbi:GNAT family N-acetyltransferase [Tepidicella baoligensis]|uniref:GNAT family N-acetyltransferase n=1 Tax=Tepidicella baoligensis TaxID=2707016 RepID=UPI0015DB1855|nr:GNAT family N-acetyltransferase [Tepidicella baoligensis]
MKTTDESGAVDYVTQVITEPEQIEAGAWNTLLQAQPMGGACGPFMRHEYLAALHASGSAIPSTGWHPRWLTLWRDEALCAAAPLYAKDHSYGEYVFDWAWAQAHEAHGLAYYPKGLVAVPFTPVPGPRLLARDATARHALQVELLAQAERVGWSSLHVLFNADTDREALIGAAWLERHTVQFHWHNACPTPHGPRPFRHFDDFLANLTQDKRKKIRQERRKVMDAGIRFDVRRGHEITASDWDFFYRCYARTYWEHGNPPYLKPAFFHAMADSLAGWWLMFIARDRAGQPIACSLVALSDTSARPQAAYGRYWGALQRVDCLHFETCYYQPLQWCIEHGVTRFEGGAQGEHKMARALLPTVTHSAHWLAHPVFADAVDRFLQREGDGMARYLAHLKNRSPLRAPG